MKTKDELAQDYINALHAEIIEWKCAVAHLQKHRDGFFPSGQVEAAQKAKQAAGRAYIHRIQEEQLNAV